VNCRSRRPSAFLWAVVVFGPAGCADSVPEPAREWTEPVSGIELVLIPAGTFTMGSPGDEIGHEPGETLHEVRLSRPFYLGKYEVTQEQWRR
jgi:formylglycine-generating enzyme required for sulfatase activity